MLDSAMTWMTNLLSDAVLLTEPVIPDPGESTRPPGWDRFQKLLSWALWGAFMLCVAGFITIGARMAIKHQKGEGGGHMASLALVGFGCIVIMSARVFVTEIVGG
ncbi:hypothetical protein [Actinomadura sp. 3N407]|uniref:hypothetical protein n=1 Tax=Actinomadura sp. 3N407 TaxID=3457423 RepID=UPI003FCD11A8